MKQTDLAWIAGFFDGEGCISISLPKNTTHQLRVTITQRDPEPLERCLAILGYGRVRPRSPRKFAVNIERCWMYLITSKRELGDFIQKMKPYSSVKYSQLLLGEKFLDTWRGHINTPVLEDLWKIRQELRIQMQAEKRRKP